MIYGPDYFKRETHEKEYARRGLLRPDQYAALLYAHGWVPSGIQLGRRPGRTLSIGCGLGHLEQALVLSGASVTAVDVADNRECKGFSFVLGGMDAIPSAEFDTVVFCESIEHIEAAEFDRAWPIMRAMMVGTHGILIVVNWENYHPLEPNGFDHVRLIDDTFYDALSERGRVLHRKGSHLVIRF